MQPHAPPGADEGADAVGRVIAPTQAFPVGSVPVRPWPRFEVIPPQTHAMMILRCGFPGSATHREDVDYLAQRIVP
jgi:hypothetical protein